MRGPKGSQGPFCAEEIRWLLSRHCRTGNSKSGKHNNNNATCDVPADNRSKLSEAQDEIVGEISVQETSTRLKTQLQLKS